MPNVLLFCLPGGIKREMKTGLRRPGRYLMTMYIAQACVNVSLTSQIAPYHAYFLSRLSTAGGFRSMRIVHILYNDFASRSMYRLLLTRVVFSQYCTTPQLAAKYGNEHPVGLGGVFVIRQGSVRAVCRA